MSGHLSEKSKRRDQMRGPRLKPAEIEWGRKAAKAANIAYDEDEFDDMLAGEEDAAYEMEADEHEQTLAAECEPIQQQLAALVGTRSSPKLPTGTIPRERDAITALAAEIRDELSMLDPKKAGNKLAELQELLQDAATAQTKRNDMTQELAGQWRRFQAAIGLTPEETAEITKLHGEAIASVAKDGGWDWEAMGDVVALENAVDAALKAAAKRAQTATPQPSKPEPPKPEPPKTEPKPAGILVGAGGVAAIKIAAMHFDPAYDEAMALLKRMEADKTTFADEPAIIEAVRNDPTVGPKMAEAAKKRREKEVRDAAEAEYERQAQAARSKSPVVHQLGTLAITQYDIDQGIWRRLTGVKSTGVRPETDQELVVTIGTSTVSFHLHGPRFAKGEPQPGEIMRNNQMTNSQTPREVIAAILKTHSRPASWDK